MILDFRGPNWFFGADIVIQILGLIISLVIAYYGYKLYKITSRKIDLYFSIAFALLSLDLITYIIAVPTVFLYYAYYYPAVQPGVLLTFAQILNFVYMFTTSLAFIFLIMVYSGIERKNVIALIALLIFALTAYSYITRSYLILAYGFYFSSNLAYLFSHILQFLGYASLLIMLVRVKYGRKKK